MPLTIAPDAPPGDAPPDDAPPSDERISVSFEVFPPKTPEAEDALWTSLAKLAPLAPDFVSVTYGAGGTTRERTHRVVRRLSQDVRLAPAAHLTCIGAARHEISSVLDDYWQAGVRHIVALRGDPPGGPDSGYQPHPQGFANATELTAAIAAHAPFEISVAVYPERHPESPSLAHDIDVLKAKVDAGATRAITQFFFDPDVFFRFVDKAHAAGLSLPIVPGIMPVTNVAAVVKMAKACGTSFPARYAQLFDGLDHDPETRRLLACSLAVELCVRLQQEGFSAFHFYTLNRADLAYAICRALGVREPCLQLAA